MKSDGKNITIQLLWLGFLATCLLAGWWQLIHAAPGDIERVSVDSNGNQGNNGSENPSISSDGRFVAFRSTANNLVSGDSNNAGDIFVHDRQTGATTRISVDSNGNQGNGDSWYPSISSDGRFIAFHSYASNLVSGESNDAYDIIVHDRQTGATTRVSVDSGGSQGNDSSYAPSISNDGRFVAFESSASNLVSDDSNGAPDIFLYDRQTETTVRVSVSSNGNQGNSGSYLPSISGDGRFVAFSSIASNLVSGDNNGTSDIFLHDRQTGSTTRVSLNSNGNEGNGWNGSPRISSDGHFITFDSYADNLVSGDNNNSWDAFVHAQETGITTLISVNSSGDLGNNSSYTPSISSDGRFIAFRSDASNLVSNDTNATDDVFIHDRQTGATTRVSVNSSRNQGNNGSGYPSISSDGRFVAFRSYASNLVTGDSNGVADIFVAELEGSITSVYLPIQLKNYINYFEGPWEQENNNSVGQANGRLRPNQPYYGYPNDEKDYFFIHLDKPGRIVVDLQNYSSTGQLQLFHQNTGNRVAYATAPPYHLDYTGPAGTYYIYIATTDGFNSTTPYTLTVDY